MKHGERRRRDKRKNKTRKRDKNGVKKDGNEDYVTNKKLGDENEEEGGRRSRHYVTLQSGYTLVKAVSLNRKLSYYNHHHKCLMKEKTSEISRLQEELLQVKIEASVPSLQTCELQDMRSTVDVLNSKIHRLEDQTLKQNEALVEQTERARLAIASLQTAQALVSRHLDNATKCRAETKKLSEECVALTTQCNALKEKLSIEDGTLKQRDMTIKRTIEEWQQKETQLEAVITNRDLQLQSLEQSKLELEEVNSKLLERNEQLIHQLVEAQKKMCASTSDVGLLAGSSLLCVTDRSLQVSLDVSSLPTQTSQQVKASATQTTLDGETITTHTSLDVKTTKGTQVSTPQIGHDVLQPDSHDTVPNRVQIDDSTTCPTAARTPPLLTVDNIVADTVTESISRDIADSHMLMLESIHGLPHKYQGRHATIMCHKPVQASQIFPDSMTSVQTPSTFTKSPSRIVSAPGGSECVQGLSDNYHVEANISPEAAQTLPGFSFVNISAQTAHTFTKSQSIDGADHCISGNQGLLDKYQGNSEAAMCSVAAETPSVFTASNMSTQTHHKSAPSETADSSIECQASDSPKSDMVIIQEVEHNNHEAAGFHNCNLSTSVTESNASLSILQCIQKDVMKGSNCHDNIRGPQTVAYDVIRGHQAVADDVTRCQAEQLSYSSESTTAVSRAGIIAHDITEWKKSSPTATRHTSSDTVTWCSNTDSALYNTHYRDTIGSDGNVDLVDIKQETRAGDHRNGLDVSQMCLHHPADNCLQRQVFQASTAMSSYYSGCCSSARDDTVLFLWERHFDGPANDSASVYTSKVDDSNEKTDDSETVALIDNISDHEKNIYKTALLNSTGNNDEDIKIDVTETNILNNTPNYNDKMDIHVGETDALIDNTNHDKKVCVTATDTYGLADNTDSFSSYNRSQKTDTPSVISNTTFSDTNKTYPGILPLTGCSEISFSSRGTNVAGNKLICCIPRSNIPLENGENCYLNVHNDILNCTRSSGSNFGKTTAHIMALNKQSSHLMRKLRPRVRKISLPQSVFIVNVHLGSSDTAEYTIMYNQDGTASIQENNLQTQTDLDMADSSRVQVSDIHDICVTRVQSFHSSSACLVKEVNRTASSSIQHPTATACVQHPTSTSCVQHPTSTSCVQHPTSTSCVEHPTSTSYVQHPTATSCVQHPTSTSCVEHPTASIVDGCGSACYPRTEDNVNSKQGKQQLTKDAPQSKQDQVTDPYDFHSTEKLLSSPATPSKCSYMRKTPCSLKLAKPGRTSGTVSLACLKYPFSSSLAVSSSMVTRTDLMMSNISSPDLLKSQSFPTTSGTLMPSKGHPKTESSLSFSRMICESMPFSITDQQYNQKTAVVSSNFQQLLSKQTAQLFTNETSQLLTKLTSQLLINQSSPGSTISGKCRSQSKSSNTVNTISLACSLEDHKKTGLSSLDDYTYPCPGNFQQKDNSQQSSQVQKDNSQQSSQVQKDNSQQSSQVQKDNSHQISQVQKDNSHQISQVQKDNSHQISQVQKDNSHQISQVQKDNSHQSSQVQKDNEQTSKPGRKGRSWRVLFSPTSTSRNARLKIVSSRDPATAAVKLKGILKGPYSSRTKSAPKSVTFPPELEFDMHGLTRDSQQPGTQGLTRDSQQPGTQGLTRDGQQPGTPANQRVNSSNSSEDLDSSDHNTSGVATPSGSSAELATPSHADPNTSDQHKCGNCTSLAPPRHTDPSTICKSTCLASNGSPAIPLTTPTSPDTSPCKPSIQPVLVVPETPNLELSSVEQEILSTPDDAAAASQSPDIIRSSQR